MRDVRVTAYISTRGRYFSTLPSAILSIANQSYLPEKLIIYDDGEHLDLRSNSLYRNIFGLLDNKGIKWSVLFGEGKGQVLNHQKALETADTEWLWRLDDDNVAEHSALEDLVGAIDPSVGAVGGLILHPDRPIRNLGEVPSNKIEDFLLGTNIQWYKQAGRKSVDHLYSTFIYRKEAGKHGYCMELSPVGHHEETLFTYQMKRNGWSLIVEPKAITWHLRNSDGGIRSFASRELWDRDHMLFINKLKEWGVKLNDFKFVVLDNGMGDHIIFNKVLPEIKAKHADKKVVIAACYPEVFTDPDVKLISIADAQDYFGDLDRFLIYKWMDLNHWDKPLEDAFRKMYL